MRNYKMRNYKMRNYKIAFTVRSSGAYREYVTEAMTLREVLKALAQVFEMNDVSELDISEVVQ